MKYRETRKEIKKRFNTILCVGYCNLANLLTYEEPFAYSTRVEGWACDYYNLGSGVCISTGYAPIGTPLNYELIRNYDDKARKILSKYKLPETKKRKIYDLLEDFIQEIK